MLLISTTNILPEFSNATAGFLLRNMKIYCLSSEFFIVCKYKQPFRDFKFRYLKKNSSKKEGKLSAFKSKSCKLLAKVLHVIEVSFFI